MKRPQPVLIHAELLAKSFLYFFVFSVVKLLGSELLWINLEKLHAVCPVHVQDLPNSRTTSRYLVRLTPQSSSFRIHTSAACKVSISCGTFSKSTSRTFLSLSLALFRSSFTFA